MTKPFPKATARHITLAGLALFALTVLLRGVAWEGNDDAFLSQLLFQPDCDWVPYISPLLARPLHTLAVSHPVVNWWGVFLLLAAGLGWMGIVYAFARSLRREVFVPVSLPAVLLVYRLSVDVLNFTRIALLVGLGGGCLCLFGVFGTEERRESWVSWALGCLLLMLSMLLRQNSGKLSLFVLGMGVFFLLLRSLWEDRSAASLRRNLLRGGKMLLVLALTLSLSLTYRTAEGSEESEYREVQHLRSAVLDYIPYFPPWEENRVNYLAAGISEADFDLMLDWNAFDTELITAERLEALLPFREKAPVLDMVKTLYWQIWAVDYLLLLLFLLPWLVWDLRRFFPPLLLEGAAMLAVAAYLLREGRLVPRVLEPLLLSAVLTALLCGALSSEKKPLALPRKAAAALCLGLAVLGTVLFCPRRTEPEACEGLSYREAVTALTEEYPEYIFFPLVNGKFPPIDFESVFTPPLAENGIRFLPLGGWQSRMPYSSARLTSWGIENPYRALVERDDVYAEYRSVCLAFLREHYGEDITASLAMTVPGAEGFSFVRYLRPMEAGERAEVRLDRCEKAGTARELSGAVLSPVPAGQRLYCNAAVSGEMLTFTAELREDGTFRAKFYGLPEEAALEEAALSFFFAP